MARGWRLRADDFDEMHATHGLYRGVAPTSLYGHLLACNHRDGKSPCWKLASAADRQRAQKELPP
jgi:hypothetical protein